MDQELEAMIEQCESYSINEHYEGERDFDERKFAGLVAQAVLDQLVSLGVLGTDGAAYRAVQARFNAQ